MTDGLRILSGTTWVSHMQLFLGEQNITTHVFPIFSNICFWQKNKDTPGG